MFSASSVSPLFLGASKFGDRQGGRGGEIGVAVDQSNPMKEFNFEDGMMYDVGVRVMKGEELKL